MKRIALLSLALMLSALAHAHAKPDGKEVKEVIDFFYNGQKEGVVLAEMKLCEDVYTKGAEKNECMVELSANALKEGDAATVWMMFMVPNDVKPQTIMLQLNHGEMTMSVERAEIKSAVRYRTWRQIKLDRPGEWKLKVFHDKGDTVELMKELTFKVAKSETQ
ncbi:MAG: hypothetical protein GWN84_09945 [Gammaproteobacteria bacterium]|nr:hypothetical protein [Gammaproteobacteria bacterium]NIR83185.1 hypothetical protein [Gammaproteobacteria bacterium]NIR90993.1 hypothetical protein [Gammaproteobacteria bacterium]NIU04350.1 hypothetical protein [Gammaproteobacteria bacterium]NIV52573.1 hypothetical protein [Gammaproteobacteria bacterium]